MFGLHVEVSEEGGVEPEVLDEIVNHCTAITH